jgi:hypothetical protein
MQVFGKEAHVGNSVDPPQIQCLQCGKDVSQDPSRVETREGSFCSACFAALAQDLKRAVARQGSDINYPAALVGGVLGGAAGAAVWWAFTVLTKIAFGLVAVVIGFAVGWESRVSRAEAIPGSSNLRGIAGWRSSIPVPREPDLPGTGLRERGDTLALGWVWIRAALPVIR